jgi:hypothetical protein
VAIRSLLAGKAFQPEEAARLVAAYERALDQLDLKDRNDPVTNLVAKKIIDIGANADGSSPETICAAALKNLGIPIRE